MSVTTEGATTPTPTLPRTSFTAAEVALMQNVPVGQIRTLCKNDELRHRRFGKHIRVPFNAVAELLGVTPAELRALFDATAAAA